MFLANAGRDLHLKSEIMSLKTIGFLTVFRATPFRTTTDFNNKASWQLNRCASYSSSNF
jgi:hypothetical protein